MDIGTGLFQVVYLDIFAHISGEFANKFINERVPILSLSIGGYWLMRVIKDDSKKPKILRI